MKQIKLEVGKTYVNRKGEEVKIVGKTNASWHLYQGSNGRWYTEAGQWCNAESPYDLIEEVKEVPETRYTFITPDDMKEVTSTRYAFAIPDGVTKLTVEQVSNRIIVEMVPEVKGPKPGDVCINDVGSVYIFKSAWGNGESHKPFAYLGDTGKLFFAGWCSPGRPATPEEAQPLWDALKKSGKRWNSETMQVEEIPEIDRIREWAMEHYSNYEGIAEAIEAYLNHKEAKK